MGAHGFDDNKNIVDFSTITSKITALEKKINNMYPVGSIYMSAKNTDPSTLFGGTWVAWGQGRVPIGMGSNGQSTYTVPGGTGGNESITLTNANLPAHKHNVTIEGFSGDRGGQYWGNGRTALRIQADGSFVQMFPDKLVPIHSKDEGPTGEGFYNNIRLGNGSTTIESTTAGYANPSAVSIVQPYITCYMWKRTA